MFLYVSWMELFFFFFFFFELISINNNLYDYFLQYDLDLFLIKN